MGKLFSPQARTVADKVVARSRREGISIPLALHKEVVGDDSLLSEVARVLQKRSTSRRMRNNGLIKSGREKEVRRIPTQLLLLATPVREKTKRRGRHNPHGCG